MSAYVYTYVEDGDSLNYSEIGGLFTDAKTALNAISEENLGRLAFGRPHIGPLYRLGGGATIYVEGDQGIHTYDPTVFPPTGLSYRSAGPSDFGSDNDTRFTRVGDPLCGGAYVGAGGQPMVVTESTGVKLGNVTPDFIGGILIGFNCEVRSYEQGQGTSTDAIFCIQYKVSGDTTWYSLPRTTRPISLDDAVVTGGATDTGLPNIDVPIQTLLTLEDLVAEFGAPGASKTVVAVRAMVSIVDGPAASGLLGLRCTNISMLPLHCRVSELP